MTQGMVISLKMMVTEMGDRGSKSINILYNFIVKEQRVDGSSIINPTSIKLDVSPSGDNYLLI